MDDEWIEVRTVLNLENASTREGIERVGSKPIHSLSREGYKSAPPDDGGSGENGACKRRHPVMLRRALRADRAIVGTWREAESSIHVRYLCVTESG